MLKYSYLLLFIVVFVSGCLTGPNDSRDNSLDPKSPDFVAEFSDLQISANQPSKNILISWRNQSSFGDGFIIEKKLSNQYEVLDTVQSQTSYLDITQEYSLEMKYRITSFVLGQKGNPGHKLKKEVQDIEFGGLRNATAFANQDSVSVQWYSTSYFDDVTTVEFKERNSDTWTEIYSVDQFSGAFHRATFDISTDQAYDFRIRLFLRNYEGEPEQFFEQTITYGY